MFYFGLVLCGLILASGVYCWRRGLDMWVKHRERRKQATEVVEGACEKKVEQAFWLSLASSLSIAALGTVLIWEGAALPWVSGGALLWSLLCIALATVGFPFWAKVWSRVWRG